MTTALRHIVVLTVFGLPSAAAAQGGIDGRLNELQRSLTALSAQLEQLKVQDQQLQVRLEKMQANIGQRLERLEKRPATKPIPRSGNSKQ